MKNLMIVQPDDYFKKNDLVESLVMSLKYISERNQLVLTIDFAMTPELVEYLCTGVKPEKTPPRDFREFVFEGVSNLRVNGSKSFSKEMLLNYAGKDLRPLVIQEVTFHKADPAKILLHFGSDGSCRFIFTALKVRRRLGRGEKINDEYVYYDAETGEEFDFYEPFKDE